MWKNISKSCQVVDLVGILKQNLSSNCVFLHAV